MLSAVIDCGKSGFQVVTPGIIYGRESMFMLQGHGMYYRNVCNTDWCNNAGLAAPSLLLLLLALAPLLSPKI